MTVLDHGFSATRLATQKRLYESNGFCLFPAVLNRSEIVRLRAECDRLLTAPGLAELDNLRCGTRVDETGKPSVERLDPVVDISEVFAGLSGHPAVIKIAETLIGNDVTLIKEKLIFKPPDTPGYSLHRDQPYYAPVGLSADAIVTVHIAIDEASAQNGAIQFFPQLLNRKVPPPPDNPFDIDEALVDLASGELANMAVGDVLAFHPNVPHRSATNRSRSTRRSIAFTYGDVQYGDRREKYYDLRRRRLKKERKGFGLHQTRFT